MPRALNLLRSALHYRRDMFSKGLRAAGLQVVDSLPDPKPGDVLLIWNRYGGFHLEARRFEKFGATVLVAENCPLGNDWRPGKWYSLAKGDVATCGGEFYPECPCRWDDWEVDLAPWGVGTELVILAQRGIGRDGVASPKGWAESVRGRFGGRIRAHPGINPCVPLEEDLRHAGAVMTWASGAAIKALALGVPVFHRHPDWVMASAAKTIDRYTSEAPLRDDAARLQAFRRLSWAMWTLDEIASGRPIERLL